VILVSMNVDTTVRAEAQRLGVDAVVCKLDFVDRLPAVLEAIFLESGRLGVAPAPELNEGHS